MCVGRPSALSGRRENRQAADDDVDHAARRHSRCARAARALGPSRACFLLRMGSRNNGALWGNVPGHALAMRLPSSDQKAARTGQGRAVAPQRLQQEIVDVVYGCNRKSCRCNRQSQLTLGNRTISIEQNRGRETPTRVIRLGVLSEAGQASARAWARPCCLSVMQRAEAPGH